MQTDQVLCKTICDTLRAVTELPDDFTYDYPLFNRFDGKAHLGLSSLDALELVVLIYETWGLDVPMEDMHKLYCVNAIAAYLTGGGVQSDG